MTQILSLSGTQLDALAAGQPGADALEVIRIAQATKRRLLLRELRRHLPAASPVQDGFALLSRAAATAPDAVDALLERPLVDAWASRCLSGLEQAGPDDPEVQAAVPYLRCIAAAAGIRAGLAFELLVPAYHGTVILPGIGSGSGLGDGPSALLRADGGGFTIVGSDRSVGASDAEDSARSGAEESTTFSAEGWWPTRALLVDGAEPWSVEIDDQDPYRACFGFPPAPRLDDAAMLELQELLGASLRLIALDHPHQASVMRQTLQAIIPLVVPTPGPAGAEVVSASSRSAYGCVATMKPADAPTLAKLLLHEVRHMTLNGVLEIVDLTMVVDEPRLHVAPWRLDPRPVEPLLHGAYAHIGVTDFWRMDRHRTEPATFARRKADFEFAYWRELTDRAIRTLAGSGELTEAGVRFVQGMAATMRQVRAEPVPESIAAAVDEVATADLVHWRVVNQRPDIGSVAPLARAFLRGEPARPVLGPRIGPLSATPARHGGLSAGIRDRALETAETAEHDAAFLRDDLGTAAGAYRDRLLADPDDTAAWVGLALSLHRLGIEPAATVLLLRPDLVRAVHTATRKVRTPQPPLPPDEVAAWLATGVDADPSTNPYGDGGSM